MIRNMIIVETYKEKETCEKVKKIQSEPEMFEFPDDYSSVYMNYT